MTTIDKRTRNKSVLIKTKISTPNLSCQIAQNHKAERECASNFSRKAEKNKKG